MHDYERISIIIDDINMYLRKIKEMPVKSENDLKDDLKFYATSMLIFSVLNRIIDLGDEIVKENKLGYPLEIKEIFVLLSEKSVISRKLETKMRDLVIARNKLSHRYGLIKTKDVFNLISDMKYAEEFVKEILKYLNKA